MISENTYGLMKKIACVSKTLILNCIYKNATDMVTELLNFSFIFVLNKNNLPCKWNHYINLNVIKTTSFG